MKLIFDNSGEIDIRGACIAGLSAKESDSPIGYFGTGLKYSIACILRWGGAMTIYSGTTSHEFRAKPIQFRSEVFQQVCMMHSDGTLTELGFTTEYGKNWQPWQVFRELYANARDEGGTVQLAEGMMPCAEHTTIEVSGVPDLIEAFYNRHEIILRKDKVWSHISDKVQVSNERANGIYYRGVRVHEWACLYTWNFLDKLKLTEDRTLESLMSVSYTFDTFFINDLHDIEMVMSILRLKYEPNEVRLTRMVQHEGAPTTLTQRPVEGLFMDWFYQPQSAMDSHSSEFKEACKRLYQRDPTTYSKLRPYVKSIDEKLVEINLHQMNRREQQMFDKAKELVALFGFKEEIYKLPIHVQELGGSTFGLYEHGTIYLSPKLFDQGTKQLVATLYEECYHHRTANADCTYNMQTDLFNIIISLNEELNGVIC